MTALLFALVIVLGMGAACSYLIYRKEQEIHMLKQELRCLKHDYQAVISKGTELEDDLRKTLDQIHRMISKYV